MRTIHCSNPQPHIIKSKSKDGTCYGVTVDTLRQKTVDKLHSMLVEMTSRLPALAVAALRPTKIWLELDDEQSEGGVYHPSSKWLRDKGMNPDKAKSVQFSASTFMPWSEDQPAMVLHEFAHAFLDQFRGNDQPDLLSAFQHACQAGLYQSERAYALNAQQEFFAELSEAYFWRNDYFPYTRGDLQKYDPASAAVIASLWEGDGKPLKRRESERPEVASICINWAVSGPSPPSPSR
jgi:hypothetical protein